jgi:hypothetical protein
MSLAASVVVMVVVVGALVTWAIREDRRLRAAARRYRELEFEGLGELPVADAYPEFAEAGGGLVEPGGAEGDAAAVLRRELNDLRRAARPAGEEEHARDHR